MKFIETLHRKDEHFVGHLELKRVIANLAALVFSAGVLFIINFAFTGNFLFFNQTTTQKMISKADRLVDPNTNLKLEVAVLEPDVDAIHDVRVQGCG